MLDPLNLIPPNFQVLPQKIPVTKPKLAGTLSSFCCSLNESRPPSVESTDTKTSSPTETVSCAPQKFVVKREWLSYKTPMKPKNLDLSWFKWSKTREILEFRLIQEIKTEEILNYTLGKSHGNLKNGLGRSSSDWQSKMFWFQVSFQEVLNTERLGGCKWPRCFK